MRGVRGRGGGAWGQRGRRGVEKTRRQGVGRGDKGRKHIEIGHLKDC